VAKGEIDGSAASLGTNAPDEGQVHLTANLPLFPKTLTLFAGDGAYDRLGEDQQDAIREAARMTAAYAAAHAPSETTLVRRFCREGPPFTAVAASAGDVAALERAAQPVYTQLERDPDTKVTIATIRTLKAAARAAAPPATCENEVATVSGPERSPSAFNGTYRWRLTVEGARRIGVPSDDEDVGSIVTMTLRDGKMMLGDDKFYSGTFEIRGNRLVLKWPQANTTNILEFERHADGTLDVKAVPPINRGDEYVIASAPWRRVGPPVRDIP
jgi:hypothetical protein